MFKKPITKQRGLRYLSWFYLSLVCIYQPGTYSHSVLYVQLAVTMAILGVFTIESVKTYSRAHQEMWWLALVRMLVSLISLACCPSFRRNTHHNFIFLGFMLGAVTSIYDANEVLMAFGVCAAITMALTVFAFQTKIDFTALGGVLIAVLMVFILFCLIAIFLRQSRTLNLVYKNIGAIIFSLYIIYDTSIQRNMSLLVIELLLWYVCQNCPWSCYFCRFKNYVYSGM